MSLQDKFVASSHSFNNFTLVRVIKTMNLKQRLAQQLTEEELAEAPRSYEVIGNIAIVKIPGALEDKKQLIASEIKQQQQRIETVLNKVEKRTGEFRTADYEVLLGNKTETIHKEHGCRYKLDPTQVYFSERLGRDREQVMKQVKQGETIHALFAGVGPYPILIAKKKEPETIYAIEKNPRAYNYLRENIMLNKVTEKVKVYQGDVKDILPEIEIKADRTLMPLPKGGSDFLELATKYTKRGGIIHYYAFLEEENMNKSYVEREQLKNYPLHVMQLEECGSYAPGVHRVRLDLKLTS